MATQEPFFSICIETNNRASTIIRSLDSVKKQTFRNFELIIIDNQSNDNTYQKLLKYFHSSEFNNKPFDYICKQNEKKYPNKLDNWNSPLNYASGKYIAFLEGDDMFLPNHLEQAYDALTNNKNIGLYSCSTTKRKKAWSGVKKSQLYVESLFIKRDIPPPSEMIFIREHKGKAFRYNTKDYIYAPEMDLYLQIANSGYDAYYNKEPQIYRDEEGIPKYVKWQSSKDFFTFNKLWGGYITSLDEKSKKEAWKSICKLTFWRYVHLRKNGISSSENMWEVIKEEIKPMNIYRYIKYLLIKFIIDILISLRLLNILLNLKERIK